MDFDRQTLEDAFARIGQKAVESGKLVEIAVYGGSALVLTLPARPATKDVDAVFGSDPAWIRQVANEIAAEREWPVDWLNDAVKGFLSSKDQSSELRHLFRTYPSENNPGLRVFVASPRYLFAMKCLAMRIGGVDETQDRADIEALANQIGVNSTDQAMDIVCDYYPHSQISAKTQMGIEEIFSGPASESDPSN